MRTKPRASTRKVKPLTRQAAPPYCLDSVAEALRCHVEAHGVAKCFDLGTYWSVPVGHAVRGAGLLRCKALLQCLFDQVPTAAVNFADLRKMFSELLRVYPRLLTAVPHRRKD